MSTASCMFASLFAFFSSAWLSCGARVATSLHWQGPSSYVRTRELSKRNARSVGTLFRDRFVNSRRLPEARMGPHPDSPGFRSRRSASSSIAATAAMLAFLPHLPAVAEVAEKAELEQQLQKLKLELQLKELQAQVQAKSPDGASSTTQAAAPLMQSQVVEDAIPSKEDATPGAQATLAGEKAELEKQIQKLKLEKQLKEMQGKLQQKSREEDTIPLKEDATVSVQAEPAVTTKNQKPEASQPPSITALNFTVDFNGEPLPMSRLLGKATIVFNPSSLDPLTTQNMFSLQQFFKQYESQGLHVIAMPTRQGMKELYGSDINRRQFKQKYDFGKFPSEVYLDTTDWFGKNAVPFLKWLTNEKANPWGVNRVVLNYEKFLLDADGHLVRRYPRSYLFSQMEDDVKALCEGKELPPPAPLWYEKWQDARTEARSQWGLRLGQNVLGVQYD